jgi:hypothetical protein
VIIGKNVLRSDNDVDLRALWYDFKHDLDILHEAGIKTIYDGNKAPEIGEEDWNIQINPSTIRV